MTRCLFKQHRLARPNGRLFQLRVAIQRKWGPFEKHVGFFEWQKDIGMRGKDRRYQGGAAMPAAADKAFASDQFTPALSSA
ncbi:hypothetical protein ACN2CC_11815 [Mesorhizobium muleiense]|uniref:hypothetical protein n=1 Tax=Mesorhizobium muleiense TaxID=1004279 RepID=UPI003AFA5FEE